MKKRFSFYPVFPCVICLALLAAASWRTVRAARADAAFRAHSAEDVARAVRIEPGNADYLLALADARERSGSDPAPVLKRALRAWPGDANAMIRLGLLAEVRGDRAEARRLLLEASQADRKYEPRWVLANFYFRAGDPREFQRWAKEAFAMSYGARTPLFDLCWRMKPDAAWLRSIAGGRRAVEEELAMWLLGRGETSAAASVLTSLSANGGRAEYFLTASDRMIAGHAMDSAATLWSSLVAHGVLPYRPWDASRGDWITNGDLAAQPQGRGFDWRMPAVSGADVRWVPRTGIVLELRGGQPEAATLLWQYMPPLPAGQYSVDGQFRIEANPFAANATATGLRWKVVEVGSGRVLGESNAMREGAGKHLLLFSAPEGNKGVRLVLEYRRDSGSMRWEGTATFSRIHTRKQEIQP